MGWLPPTLKVLRTTPQELWALAQQAPCPGDWLCPACWSWNSAHRPRCGRCTKVSFLNHPGIVKVPGGAAFRDGDWECTWCERLQFRSDTHCHDCGRAPIAASGENSKNTACCNQKCTTRPEVLAAQGPLKADLVDGQVYCNGCWSMWERSGHCQSTCST